MNSLLFHLREYSEKYIHSEISYDHSVLKHEVMSVPLSLEELNGELHTGNKSSLTDVLVTDIDCSENINYTDACIIVDGKVVVASIGKPKAAKTSGYLAHVFVRTVMHIGKVYKRFNLVFDRYKQE